MLTPPSIYLILALPLSILCLSVDELSACQISAGVLLSTCNGQSAQLDALDIFCPRLRDNLPLFESLIVDVGKIADGCLSGDDRGNYGRLTGAMNDDGEKGIYEKLCGCHEYLKDTVSACEDALSEYQKKGCPEIPALNGAKVTAPAGPISLSGDSSKDLLEFLPSSDTCKLVNTQRSCTYDVSDYENAGFCPCESQDLADHCLVVQRFEQTFQDLCNFEQFVANSLSKDVCDRVIVTVQPFPNPTRASLPPSPSCEGSNSTARIHHPTEPANAPTYAPSYRLVEPTSNGYIITSGGPHVGRRMSASTGGFSVMASVLLLIASL